MTAGRRRRLPQPSRLALAAVVVVGLAVRAILVPITHGPDFTVWDLASRATLSGVNVFAHHPAYSGGPYTYLPLFLYVEVPMQWLALHTGVSFTVWGKLPIVAGDALTTLVIARELRRRGCGPAQRTAGAALFWLNPLVVYNGAFYGRFDSVCVGLLLLALCAAPARVAMPWRAALAYAASVCVKTFPLFAAFWPLRRDPVTARRVIVSVAVTATVVSLPYLVSSPHPFLADLLYGAGRPSGSLSWQVTLHALPTPVQLALADALLVIFAAAAVVLGGIDDMALSVSATLLLFLLLSKEVIEQYLLWPLPFLIILAVASGSRAAGSAVMLLLVAAALDNAYIHPFGLQPAVLDVLFAAVLAAVAVWLLGEGGRRGLQLRPWFRARRGGRSHVTAAEC